MDKVQKYLNHCNVNIIEQSASRIVYQQSGANAEFLLVEEGGCWWVGALALSLCVCVYT